MIRIVNMDCKYCVSKSASDLLFEWGELEYRIVSSPELHVVEDCKVEVAGSGGEIVGGQSVGNQATEILPISGDEVVEGGEANELVLVGVGSARVLRAKITGRIPESIEKLGVIDNQPGFGPRSGWRTALFLEALVNLDLRLVPIENLDDTASR